MLGSIDTPSEPPRELLVYLWIKTKTKVKEAAAAGMGGMALTECLALLGSIENHIDNELRIEIAMRTA